ncbi:co-chaperone GroES [Streptococcus macacae]|uniref:Co-chaperonin GroES n=1 Tax=Streptococcus macacae NCTC 11558 TaxID=764298 RepID=G5JV17_9STRE|nr:co-chaperone GroES [Streptococcus macacae]EHJ51957.1 chaperonin GroS [Streptococcus macacae NCTC 11558]SUN79319.1 co-chaperonin GroES [Streptococcus macacae NCTC 11558]
MLKPLGDRLVVELKEEKEQKVGGFVLAGSGQEKTKKAQVVAVGEGVRTLNGDLVALSVHKDDTVLIENHVGTSVKDDDKDYLIIREADVLAIIEN